MRWKYKTASTVPGCVSPVFLAHHMLSSIFQKLCFIFKGNIFIVIIIIFISTYYYYYYAEMKFFPSLIRANSLLLKMLMESWFKTFFFLHFFCCCCFCFFKTLQQAGSGIQFLRPTQRKILEFGLLATTGRSCLAQLLSSQCGFARWGGWWVGGEELEGERVFVSYVESWLTTLPPFMVGVPELFLERPCFSPISCSDGSLYMHTAKRKDTC